VATAAVSDRKRKIKIWMPLVFFIWIIPWDKRRILQAVTRRPSLYLPPSGKGKRVGDGARVRAIPVGGIIAAGDE
jgi:hypothetical protein